MTEGAAQVVRLVAEANQAALDEQLAAAMEVVGELRRFSYWMTAATGMVILAATLLAWLSR